MIAPEATENTENTLLFLTSFGAVKRSLIFASKVTAQNVGRNLFKEPCSLPSYGPVV